MYRDWEQPLEKFSYFYAHIEKVKKDPRQNEEKKVAKALESSSEYEILTGSMLRRSISISNFLTNEIIFFLIKKNMKNK